MDTSVIDFWERPIIFSKKFLEDISHFRGVTNTPFWTSGDVCLGFQSQGGSLYVLSRSSDPHIYLWCDTC